MKFGMMKRNLPADSKLTTRESEDFIFIFILIFVGFFFSQSSAKSNASDSISNQRTSDEKFDGKL